MKVTKTWIGALALAAGLGAAGTAPAGNNQRATAPDAAAFAPALPQRDCFPAEDC